MHRNHTLITICKDHKPRHHTLYWFSYLIVEIHKEFLEFYIYIIGSKETDESSLLGDSQKFNRVLCAYITNITNLNPNPDAFSQPSLTRKKPRINDYAYGRTLVHRQMVISIQSKYGNLKAQEKVQMGDESRRTRNDGLVVGVTLKQREWVAKDKASPLASEKQPMKGKAESRATILCAWASTNSTFSTASRSSAYFSISFFLPFLRRLLLSAELSRQAFSKSFQFLFFSNIVKF